MAARKGEEGSQEAEVVLSPFAYAEAHSGEIVQLVKGDVVDPARYRTKSLEHLRSIGFVGAPK